MQNEETSKQEDTMEQNDAETERALTETPTELPTPTNTPSLTPTNTPSPAPVAHTIYDGTTVELSDAEVGDVVLFGAYEQDNITSNGAESIPWYVLDKDGDNLLLMSVYLLDHVPYHVKYEDITWEDCTLRQWMNDDFYNSAFTASEKKYIRTSYLENADNPYSGTEGGNDTNDKVFALSLAEAEQYFGIAYDGNDYWYIAIPELSAAKVTAYAEAQGAYVSDYESTANGCWWLRSPGFHDHNAAYVNFDDIVSVGGSNVDDAYYDFLAVRPALWLNLNPANTTPSPTPTVTPTPAVHTIYDVTTVELSKAKVGDVVLFGSYEQDNIASNGTEAIPWYVLDKDGDKLLLMSVYLLDAVQYHEKWEDITWEDCTLRQWMNDDFYSSAFTKSEKKYIRTSYLENADNPTYGTEGGNDTEDKVFALSLAEAAQYFGIAEDEGSYWVSESPELSAAKVTAYAEAQGAWKSTAGNGWWWLRSPGSFDNYAAGVDYAGYVYVCGNDVDYDHGAVRPALWLNLNP